MFWSCPALATYWSTIFKMLSEALNINLQPNAAMAIFGTTDRRHTTLRKSYKNVIVFTTLLARRRILLHFEIKKSTQSVFVVMRPDAIHTITENKIYSQGHILLCLGSGLDALR